MREAHSAAEAGMQTEHHFRKTKPGIVDRDPHLAGQRHFEAAAEAKTVDHGDGRNPQRLHAVDHRMRAADLGFNRAGIGGAAEFVDVGSGNEAGSLGGANDEAGRPRRFELGQHLVELFNQIRRERIGAGSSPVEQQPGDAVFVPRELEILVRPARIGLRPEFEHAIGEKVHDL